MEQTELLPQEQHLANLLRRDAELENLTFEKLQLIGTDIRDARLVDCIFDGCTISSPVIEGALLKCAFRHSKIEGVNFFMARKSMMSLSFDNCLIRHSSFATLKLKKLKLTNCIFKNVDFGEADLSEADFSGSSFEDCIFQQTNLTKANFRDAFGYYIDPRLNKIDRAQFSYDQVTGLLAPLNIVIE